MNDADKKNSSSASGELEHTADLGLWVEARSVQGLFSSAVCSLAEVLIRGTREAQISWRPVRFEDENHAGLLVALLNEVLYLAETEAELAVAFDVQEIDPVHLVGRIGVIPLTGSHVFSQAIKAATYHQASVKQLGDQWRAEVYLDV